MMDQEVFQGVCVGGPYAGKSVATRSSQLRVYEDDTKILLSPNVGVVDASAVPVAHTYYYDEFNFRWMDSTREGIVGIWRHESIKDRYETVTFLVNHYMQTAT